MKSRKSSENRGAILRERWAILRKAGCPAEDARDARTSAEKFRVAMAAQGIDASAWPHLLNSWRGARLTYSTAVYMVEQRRRRARLKALGLDWVRCDNWSRSAKSMRRVLKALHEGREIPEYPSMMVDG